ncbi:MAG: helix-turn-helix transcriptional regulator [Acidobacteria bacterium]|nr:helix-turn-helix transcriptional regulator [Acidobacteriota bacterium]
MSRQLKPLREVLARAVAAARLDPRRVEEALGVPRGTWDHVLSGKRVLRVRHLLAFARLLSVPPEDLLEAGLPEASQPTGLTLADWIEPARPRFAKPQPGQPAEDLQTLIRDIVRRELDAAGEKDERSSR